MLIKQKIKTTLLIMTIRKYKAKDRNSLIDICYHTGYMGEDCEVKGGRNHFTDKKLFGLLFCQYYLDNEPENCFVAEVNGRVVGYIIGTLNSSFQSKRFATTMILKIIFRLFFITLIKHVRDFFMLMGLIVVGVKIVGESPDPSNISPEQLLKEYPAHLHINLLEGYQRKGLGSQLMNEFTMHLKKHGINGVHLETSTQNKKAIPFYRKQGFKIVSRSIGNLWRDVPNASSLIFAKKL